MNQAVPLMTRLFPPQGRPFLYLCIWSACTALGMGWAFQPVNGTVTWHWWLGAAAWLLLSLASRQRIPGNTPLFFFNLFWLVLLTDTCLHDVSIDSPLLLLFGLIPAVAVLMLPRPQAILWCVLTLVNVVTLQQLAPPGLPSLPLLDRSLPVGVQMLPTLWLSLVGVGLVLLSELRLRSKIRQLAQHNQAIDSTSQKLISESYHKDRFLATVSHEMRTPLNAIHGYLNLLESSGTLPTLASTYVKGAQDASAHLLAVVNDLLDFSQIQQGQLVLTPQAVDLHAVLQEAHRTLVPRATAQQLGYTLECAETVPRWCMLDPNRLRQIIINLLGNAIKFTRAGEVSLHASARSNAQHAKQYLLTLTVRDTGIGISEQNLQHIFEPFVQLNQTLNTEDNALQGNGLGLSITRGLVNSWGGKISVRSERHKGSVFTVELPIHAIDPPLQVVAQQQVSEQRTKAVALNILVVDDHAANRMVASLTLKQALPNARIDEARNGTEGLDKMRKELYDIVLMDLVMPDIGGIEVVRQIRGNAPPGFSDVPVIAVTANVAEENTQACRELGFAQVIPKPFDRDALVQAVLEHSRSR